MEIKIIVGMAMLFCTALTLAACQQSKPAESSTSHVGTTPDADSDGDSVPDRLDACPRVSGQRSDDPKVNGCPVSKDQDGDGIVDDNDACPTAAGLKATDLDPTTNGCPPR